MKIVDYSTVSLAMNGDMKSVQHFGSFLGSNTKKLGLVATLYSNLSATYLTDSLMNIYFNEQSGNPYQPIDAMVFEWEIDVNRIKQVYISEDTSDTGANQSPIRMVLAEKYYEKSDTFVLENKQQLFVTRSPRMLAPNRWEYYVIIAGNNPLETLDLAYATKGRYTRYRSNFHGEFSSRGYSKFHSNIEKHRGHISLHRASVSWTSQYALQEEIFINTGKGKNSTTGKEEEMFFRLNKKEKECLDTLYLSKNNNMLFGKTNFDVNGKCLIQDAETGEDVPMSDGIIAQIERYCDKLMFNSLTVNVFDEVISTLRSKAQTSKGNTFTFIVNDRMDGLIGKTLREYLRTYQPTGNYFFTRKNNGVVQVGADFDSYMIQGNTITFVVDRNLSIEYPDRALTRSALIAKAILNNLSNCWKVLKKVISSQAN